MAVSKHTDSELEGTETTVLMPGFNILVIEDELSTLTILEDTLTSDNIHITPVCTEAGANKYLRKDFHMFVIDLNLPDGSGINLIKRIRRLDKHANTPIIVSSGSVRSADILASFQAGATDYIVKPINTLILKAKTRFLLRHKLQFDLLQKEARTDPLTQLLNSNALLDDTEKVWNKSKQTGLPFSTLLIDIENLSFINEEAGYDAGDNLLIDIAVILRKALTSPEQFCGRLQGDNFVIVLPQKSFEEAKQVADFIFTQVSLNQHLVSTQLYNQPLPPLNIAITQHSADEATFNRDIFTDSHCQYAVTNSPGLKNKDIH